MTDDEALEHVRNAYRKGDLTLYLGAGVSVGNGLPTWDQLALSMYFEELDDSPKRGEGRPLPNYLFAIAEWQLTHSREMPEITARKVRQRYGSSDEFLQAL